MVKRGWLVLGIGIVIVFFLIAFFYFALASPKIDFDKKHGKLANPAENLTFEEVKLAFNEDFVYYLLYSIKAYNLHNVPLTNDLPRIEIKVGNEVYSAVIQNGEMLVAKESIENPDVRIVTSLEEAAKMVKYSDYVKTSFESGSSDIEMLANKATLFSKGYLNLYTEVTGKSITGNVVRIYTS